MKNRICFYVYGYPPDFSGATLQAIRLSKILKKRQISSSFLAYTFNPKHLNDSGDQDFPLTRFIRPKGNSLFLYHYRLFLSLFKNRKNFDIIYINGNDGQFWTVFYIVLFKCIFSKKVLFELNMEFEDPLRIQLTSLAGLKMFAASRIDAYISLSTAIRQRVLSLYGNLNVVSIFNGVDVSTFKPAKDSDEVAAIRDELGLPIDKKIMVTCGGISRRKGIDFLLDVWKKVDSEYVGNCLFVILGPITKVEEGYSSKFIDDIIELVKQEPFADSVLLKGTVTNVEAYFRAADVFGFAGRQEGSPNVLREAMSSGLPIVSLELKGITSDMIDNGHSGIIIPVENQKKLRSWRNESISTNELVESFSRSVCMLFTNREYGTSLGMAAREAALAKFSIELQAEKLISLIDQVCNEK